MSRQWVLDASPLILLAAINEVHLLEQLTSRLIVPDAVVGEIESGPERDKARKWLAQRSGLITPPVSIPPEVLTWSLGAGESAAISHVLQDPTLEAILDDTAGRACAASLGVRVRGTLGILLLAKREGLIQRLQPKLNALHQAGMWIDAPLRRKVLDLAGES